MKSMLDLGFISIHYYSIFLLIAFALGCILIFKEVKAKNISKEFIENLLFWTVIFSILGARLYFVVFNFDYYLYNPLEIFMVWNGGLAIHGGIIAGLLTVLYYCHKYKINSFQILDIIVVSLILGQAIGRWGNFFNGEAHGPIVSLDTLQALPIPSFVVSGMYIDGNYYLPTFFFESMLCLIGFVILLLFRKRKNVKTGQTTSLYLIYYGLVRFFIESFRTDSLMLLNLKMAQIISIIMIISGIILFVKCRKDNLYNEVGEE
ncbi:MAG: prolipoprotein diacylglyceryl transferase [Bacilli bacterium]|nr:prolipoprotein diacylglyceryl transferase [Bacilli bacterium]